MRADAAVNRFTDVRQVMAQRDRADVRLHRLAERVHALGPAPMLHAMIELAGGADLRATLERYADLPADFIRQHGGDRFARPLHVVLEDVA